MEIILYTDFSKRENSTKIPSADSGTGINVLLKRNTSKYNPSFILDQSVVSVDIFSVKYLKWSDNYYYVTDIVYINNDMLEIQCRFDPYATDRSTIFNYSAFVARSSSNYDTLLPDELLNGRTVYLSQRQQSASIIDHYSATGCYILKVVGGGTNSSTGITTYAMSISTFKSVMDFMFNEDNFADVLADAAVKSVFNPFQYIVSLQWTPFVLADIAATIGRVKLGLWDTGIDANIVTIKTLNVSVDLPFITPSYGVNDWRRYDDRYTKWTVRLPFVGNQPISAMEMEQGCRVLYYFDFNTGISVCRCINADNIQIAEWQCKCTVDIQIGQQASDLGNLISQSNVLSGALGGAIAGLTNRDVGNAVNGIIQTVGSITGIAQPTPSTNGNAGSMANMESNPYVITYLQEVATTDSPTSEIGRPCYKQLTLSTLSGSFVICLNASVPTTLPEPYKSQINATLNGGMYLE